MTIRYAKAFKAADRRTKGRILDDVVSVTGWLRALPTDPGRAAPAGRRPAGRGLLRQLHRRGQDLPHCPPEAAQTRGRRRHAGRCRGPRLAAMGPPRSAMLMVNDPLSEAIG